MKLNQTPSDYENVQQKCLLPDMICCCHDMFTFSHDPYLYTVYSKFRQEPDSLTYSKNRCQCSVHERRSFRGFGTFGFGIGKRGLFLFFTWFRNNSVRRAFAYHGIWESGQMLGVRSRPSDGDVKWRSREQDWGRIHMRPASLSSEHSSKWLK